MSFDVYSDRKLATFLHSYDTLSAALAALERNNALVLQSGYVFDDPIRISVDNIALFSYSNGASLVLDPTISRFRLGGTGDSSITVLGHGSNIWGNSGNDSMLGSDGRDILRGNNGNDFLVGGGGSDSMKGGNGNDFLLAGAGRDNLSGGKGDDFLVATQGKNHLFGNAGADQFVVGLANGNHTYLRDFSLNDGDMLHLTGTGGIGSLAGLMAIADISQNGNDTLITLADSSFEIRNFDLSNLADIPLTFGGLGDIPNYDLVQPGEFSFADFGSFLASGLADFLTEVDIDGTTYHIRQDEPLHDGYKYLDNAGSWWSPDYFVLVAAGQSNMLGAGTGGDMALDGNVITYDWVNGQMIHADYGAAPAGGPGVRTGTALRNNLYFPLANHLAEDLDRPVLVIARPVSGSRIDSWLADGENATPGIHWFDLTADVTDVLTSIGQDKIDLFTWLQGESDYPVPHEVFKQKFLDFMAQVRGADWADADTAMLIGELSREGVNFNQNRVFQEIELEETDPNLGFVSSTGLSTFDIPGVHFDGASLVEYGYERFWAEYLRILQERAEPGSSDIANSAPEFVQSSAPPTEINLLEGGEFRLDVASYFKDPDGDQMYFYSYLSKRGHYLDTTSGDEIVIRPGFEDSGSYTLTIYASDYYLDGDSFDIRLNILDNTPLIQAWSNRNFDKEMGAYLNLDLAQDALGRNRGIEILDQSAISLNGPNNISIDTLHIKGAAGLSGQFTLIGPAYRAYLYGQADFDYTGNAQDNLIFGNDGDNILTGLTGNDRLYGGLGDDMLIGGAGNDTLYGDAGNDVFDGGSGVDQVWGGDGADIFHFSHGDEDLRIRDFDHATEADQIVISGFSGITDFASFMDGADFRQSLNRLIVDFPDERLLIYDVTEADLTTDMFIFV